MNSKNILQEFCQKNKYPLPSYNTLRISGDDTHPIFESTIVFENRSFKATGNSKVEAEKSVAKTAYDICETLTNNRNSKLTQKYDYDLLQIPIDYETIYLIDGDNYTISGEEEKVFEEYDSLFIYFIAKNNTRPQPIRQQQEHDNCCIFISDSISHDAVDHLISFFLGKMSVIWTGKKYYIVTRDHFAECLEKFQSNTKVICSFSNQSS